MMIGDIVGKPGRRAVRNLLPGLKNEYGIEVDNTRLDQIRLELEKILDKSGQPVTQVTRPTPRQVRMFTTKTRVNFDQDITNHRTIMELIANDRPRLLSTVGRIFVEFDVYIENAKIVTVGERAEDVFYLTDLHGSPLSEKSCKSVRDKLIQSLDNQI